MSRRARLSLSPTETAASKRAQTFAGEPVRAPEPPRRAFDARLMVTFVVVAVGVLSVYLLRRGAR